MVCEERAAIFRTRRATREQTFFTNASSWTADLS